MSGSFTGNDRFQLIRQLGSGGMGIVYEVLDRQENRRIALKVLKSSDADGLVRLKKEFRAAAGLHHPNLVALHELFVEGDTWFFTLELLDGVELIDHVRPLGASIADAPTGGLDVTVRARPSGPLGPDLARLRPAISQLAQGIAAIHRAGRLHRDLKPSNVLVTRDGRVVILDFGLATQVDGEKSISEIDGMSIVGTPDYMAPEQAGSGQVSAASDWYAFGTILYQALTGRLPYEGSALAVLEEKQRRAPVPPNERCAGVPDDLATLCVELLRIEPGTRPRGDEILTRLGTTVTAEPERREHFVGRDHELKQLLDALERARAGKPQLVTVVGPSGIGKTALMRRFLERAEQSGAVVLSGRCHERETLPFKALDSAVDSLTRYLGGMSHERVDALVPRDAWALGNMFPALNRVRAFATAKVKPVQEPSELRRRATGALRELIGRITDRAALVVFIDDLHWTDVDSAQLVAEVLRPPDAPALLLVGASRELVDLAPGAEADRKTISLAPLTHDECLALAERTLPADQQARAVTVASESGGNPFLLEQLASYGGTEKVGVDGLVMARAKDLPDDARTLLEVISVAGRPTRQHAVMAASGLAEGEMALRMLRGAQLVRTDDGKLEVSHDRIRATVSESVSPERQAGIHRKIAAELEARAPDELDAIAFHLAAAGEHARAADATAKAARKAEKALAFERSAVLFRTARDLLPEKDPRRREITVALAGALAQAGRGDASAKFYRQALDEPGAGALTELESLELRRNEAEQLLRIGHVDEGMEAIREVLGEVKLSLPRGPVSTFASLLGRRAALTVRGLEFSERKEADCDPADLRRVDVCWSASVGLAMVDTLRGATVGSKQLLLALEAGEAYRVARALAAEAAFGASIGARGLPRAHKLLQRSRTLAAQVGDGRLQGLVEFCAGLSAFMAGQFAEARQLHEVAEQRFQEIGAAVTWEASTARLVSVWSMVWLGDLIEVFTRRLPSMLAEARLRGDRYTVTGLQSGLAIMEALALDEPERARSSVHEVLARWSQKSFQFQHYWSLLSEGMIDLYIGEPEAAWKRMNERWGALRKSLFLSIQLVRIEARFLRARAALATGRLGEALDDAESIEGEGVGYGRALAGCIRAGVAEAQGLHSRALGLYSKALELFDQSQMKLYATATRSRLGQLQGGELGAANTRAAEAWLIAQGVKKPAKMVDMLVPRATLS